MIASDGALQIRIDTSSNWSSANPILEAGELAVESDTNKLKCGDGVKNWNALSYIGGSGYTKSEIDQKVADINSSIASQSYVPVGAVYYFATNTAPSGYLVCDGSKVSRTTYATLFNAIGTTFGNGDGTTTFTLPNLIDKFAQGSKTVGTEKEAGLPNIEGQLGLYGTEKQYSTTSGAFTTNDGSVEYGADHSRKAGLITDFNASNSNAIYGKSTTVQPPALTLLPCIKF